MKTKKRVAKKSNLEALVRAVCAEYAQDPSKPSVLLSLVGSGGEWYAAIVRYTGKWGEGKYVVRNARGETMEAAVNKLAAEWLGMSDAKRSLRAALYDDCGEF